VPKEVEAVHTGHVDVANYEFEGALLESLPGFLAVSGLLDITLDPQMLEHLAEHPADGRHVIHNQDVQGTKKVTIGARYRHDVGQARHKTA
jgi:hypothetical protein